ncbi:helix-turn-helix domain-containing protein [Longicatena caecimuris]|uniref:helix-turn-helix domain-containing protein n=1 Tax=Longicatena caecimuris TaxID=1796635 RepID=UPI00214CC8DE|nr:helix-turn-helix domain-containing protein [Longicatena caecimuris]MCR1871523.1 helix-turn-helix domain-containing protein [Longicatena caecimuris]
MLSEKELKNIIKSGIIERIKNTDDLKFAFGITEKEWDKMQTFAQSSTDLASEGTCDVDYQLNYINSDDEEDFVILSCNFNILEKDPEGYEDEIDDYNINNVTISIDEFELLELEDVLDLSEASQKYGININTLKSACQKGLNGLIEGIDYKKSGRVWLITKNAIKKVWGNN